MVERLARPLKILDVGGRQTIWENVDFVNEPDIHITLLNIEHTQSSYANVYSALGDARHMSQFDDQQFDVVYSNSVIEHVGSYNDMRLMAKEIQRVGEHYFLQTPYRYFPIEPHFVCPLFQFLPLPAQVSLLQHFDLGWFRRTREKAEAERAVRSIQLLSKSDLHSLFMDAVFEDERVFGITKSLLAYKM